MNRTLRDLSTDMIGTSIRIPYTQVEGVLYSFDLDYEDDVRLEVDGNVYYLPADYPVAESLGTDEYDPAVLLGVVDPWSPL